MQKGLLNFIISVDHPYEINQRIIYSIQENTQQMKEEILCC